MLYILSLPNTNVILYAALFESLNAERIKEYQNSCFLFQVLQDVNYLISDL